MTKNDFTVTGGSVSIGKLAIGDGASIVHQPPGDSAGPHGPSSFQIFLSYRRSDGADVAGRIYDRLAARFGTGGVFKDVDSIPLSVAFPKYLRDVLKKVRVVLAIIGPGWLAARDTAGKRRLDDPTDFVRLELEAALALDVPIVPVMVANAAMPAAPELPEAIRSLVFRNGLPVRADPDFHRDMDRLIEKLETMLDPH